jgi:hypothetical protein
MPSINGAGGGTISPANGVLVSAGQTVAFTITPDFGYMIAAVGGTCNGELNDNVFTTAPVDGNCTVIAAFGADVPSLVVTPSVSGGGGVISPSSTIKVQWGQATQLMLIPNPGYKIASVDGTCNGTLNGNAFTTSAIVDDCTVVAKFTTTENYTASPSVDGQGGSIAPATSVSVQPGQTTSFTLTPNPGNSAFVGGTCGGILNGNVYTTAPITKNCTVAVIFSAAT